MTAKANPTRFFTRLEAGWEQWFAAHPKLPWPIRFDLREPDRISLLDSISFEAGRVKTKGKSVDQIQSAFAERFGLTDTQAENVVEGWLCWSNGWLLDGVATPPTFLVEPIAKPHSNA